MNQMKSFLRHLKANPLYAGSFSNREDVFSSFQKPDDPKMQILYACYENENYEGSASVIYYRKDTRKYYYASGAHCSCYGLEGQWDGDEELLPEVLENRLRDGNLYDRDVLKNAFEKFKEGR